ncbi:MAG TPA: ATP-binding protein [Acidimicrobiia bacterium]|jgi:two-component system sensor histidine kinase SenX3
MSPQRRDQNAETELALARARQETDTVVGQRDRLLAALDELRQGVLVLDADGTEVFRNDAAERYRDARHADAVVAGALDALISRARVGERCERELQLHSPPRAVVHLSAVPIGSHDRPLGVAAFVNDVSEMHRVESVRRDFVANVSHELKTPIGALEVLAETLVAEDDPAVTRPLAERIVKEAERLARIVDDLLDLSLIETQESPPRTPVLLEALVDDAVDQLRPAAAAAGINLQVHPGATGALVACDRRQVVSALANLIDNAVKYSEQGSPVTVSTALLGDEVEVSVRDAGIGIPSRDLERIFERFYRVDQARSRDTGGTGLGLSIVRHVARAHGGDITVESVEGQGSTFRFVLPLEPESAALRSPQQEIV